MAKSRWIAPPSALKKKSSLIDPTAPDDGGFREIAAALATNARTISGSSKADRLIGTSGNDVLSGLGGNDLLDGRKGRDRMTGGTGNDTYIVDNTRDRVIERAKGGTDLVKASVNWTLSSQVENLTLTGSKALKGTGNGLANTITGNKGHNILNGKGGADRLAGGKGNDTYIVDNARDRVTEKASQGIDTVQASVNYTLGAHVENLLLTGAALFGTGNELANRITGNGLANRLDGAAGNDTLDGGAGDDTLDGGTGVDNLTGGLGDDVYHVDETGDVVTEAAGGGSDTVHASVDYTLGDHVERLILVGGALRGTGNAQANTITGNAGNNTLDGGVGADTLDGGAGNDIYVVDEAGDVIVEAAGGGTDTVRAALDYTLSSHVENLILVGAAIAGTGNAQANAITGNALDNRLDGGAGADTLDGGAGNDTLIGGLWTDLLLGGEGDDLLEGGLDSDTLEGGLGNDSLDGGDGADRMAGGQGDDAYVVGTGDVVIEEADGGTDKVWSSIDYTLGAHVEHLALIGVAVAGNGNALDNAITGNTLDNTLHGGEGADTLDGGAGADTLIGGAGNDVYVVDHADDVIDEQGGEDDFDTVRTTLQTYFLGAGIEALAMLDDGGTNANGNSLNNDITTGRGDDFLNGGSGADTLRGGAGNDTYMIDHAEDVIVENAGEGIDTVRSQISYILGGHLENLTLMGTAARGGGNGLDNILTGNSGNNTLEGFDGNDTLNGAGGQNELKGGLGDDLYIAGAGDTVIEAAGEGIDTVEAIADFTLPENVEVLVLTGTGNINGTGNGADNRIVGNSGNNILNGGGGTDTLEGGAGNDIYVVDSTSETIIDTSGVDTLQSPYDFGTYDNPDRPYFLTLTINHELHADIERLELIDNAIVGVGNTGNNHILGNAKNNVLYGRGGNDTINGGRGDDVIFASLTGDSGSTTIEITGAFGNDTIRRFNPWRDFIDLRSLNNPGSIASYSLHSAVDPEYPHLPFYRVFVWANGPGYAFEGNLYLHGLSYTPAVVEVQLKASILLSY